MHLLNASLSTIATCACGFHHFLKMDGKVVLMFRKLQATEGVGRDLML